MIIIVSPATIGHCENEKIWYVHDVITPSLDLVKWSEEGGITEPISWVADGRWTQASMTQSLVGQNDIFVSTYEKFNWPLVRDAANAYYNTVFNTFSDFENAVKNNPGPWLEISWEIDTQWYGVSMNTTRVFTSYDETTSNGELWAFFHITHIPEYLVAQGNLEEWLTGFDLTPVSTGGLKLWEFSKAWDTTGITYSLRFEAPSSLLIQQGNNFTCNVPVSAYYQGSKFKVQQTVDVNMPAGTTIEKCSPSTMSTFKDNMATFEIPKGSNYPASYIVESAPQAKSLAQALQEAASLWLFTPGGWAAIASLLVLGFTGIRGRQIWHRNKLYHRLYKGMVTLYDLYAKDNPRFHREMDTISSAVFTMLVEDKITDEQFEKLLKRSDELIDRSDKQFSPPPPIK
jgi:hypothetical protein